MAIRKKPGSTATRKKPEDSSRDASIRTVDVLQRVQTGFENVDRLAEAGKLEQSRRLENAANSVLSALVAGGLTRRYMMLPEAVRPFLDLLYKETDC